jgi:ubiquitin-activating enzyme E1
MLAYGASAELNPMAAMFGGLVGQELVKACTGKFQPLHQYFYFDSAESLPMKEFPLSAEEYQPMGTRYDSQVAVFGRTMQEKISKLQVRTLCPLCMGFVERTTVL